MLKANVFCHSRGCYHRRTEGRSKMKETKKVLVVVMMDVDPAHDEEYNRWANEEHVAGFLKIPGVLSARRYKAVPDMDYGKFGFGNMGRTPGYLTIYEHESIEVQQTEAYQKVRFTPWSDQMRQYFKNRMRNSYVQIYPKVE